MLPCTCISLILTFGRFCEVEWILYFHVVNKFLGLARIILWNLLGIIRSILLVCPSQAKVAQEKKKKGLQLARPTSASQRLLWSAETTSASSSDCGIASLVMLKNQLSKNAAMPSAARAKAWCQRCRQGAESNLRTARDDAVIEHAAFPNEGRYSPFDQLNQRYLTNSDLDVHPIAAKENTPKNHG